MKNLKSIALALVVAFATVTVSAQVKKIDAAKSSINWVAKKVGGMVHVMTDEEMTKAIKKFGKDGKRILGIHILVPIDKELEPFFKQPEHLEQEAKMKEDLFYTQKIIEKRDLDPELPPEVELPIKNTEVHMAKEKDTKTFNLTNVADEDGDEPME